MLKKFEYSLKEAMSHDLNFLLQEYASESIYAIALTTDSGFNTIRLAFGTVSFLEFYAHNYTFNSLEEFSGIAWNPEEWNIFSDDILDSKLTTLHLEINNISMILDDFERYKSEMEKIFIHVFKTLNLGKDSGKIFKFIYDTDPSDDEYLPNKSSKILNSPNLHKEFIKRYEKIFCFYPVIKIQTNKKLIP